MHLKRKKKKYNYVLQTTFQAALIKSKTSPYKEETPIPKMIPKTMLNNICYCTILLTSALSSYILAFLSTIYPKGLQNQHKKSYAILSKDKIMTSASVTLSMKQYQEYRPVYIQFYVSFKAKKSRELQSLREFHDHESLKNATGLDNV